MKRFLCAALGAAAVVAVGAAFVVAPAHAASKITICHVPPGNPENAHTIEVSSNAWRAHQQHGDSMGQCPELHEEIPEEPGTGGTPAGNNEFTIVVCGGKPGGSGRVVQVNETGRTVVREAECQQ